MNATRLTTIALRALAVTLLVGTVVSWLVGSRLVEAAYQGRSFHLLNSIVSERTTHPLQDYLRAFRSILIVFSVAALAASALACCLSWERGRKLIATSLPSSLPLVLLAIAAAWTVTRARTSFDLPHLGDEDEKIVAGWLVSEGERLYDGVFAHHGALNYMVAHGIYAATRSKELAPYRLSQWLIVGLAAVALAASPVLRRWQERLTAGSCFLILVATFFPVWAGHLLLYHVQGGVLFTAVLSLLMLPLALGTRVPPAAAIVGGAAVAALVAAAYWFTLPLFFLMMATLCFALAHDHPVGGIGKPIALAVVGALVVAILVGAWLLRHGNLLGYLVYHIYFSQVVYAPFERFDALGIIKQLRFLWHLPLALALGMVLAFPIWLRARIKAEGHVGTRTPQRLLLLVGMAAILASLLSLNPRAKSDFKAAPLYVVSVALFSLAWASPATPRSSGVTSATRQAAIAMALALLVASARFTPLLGPVSQESLGQTARRAAEKEAGMAGVVGAVRARVSPSEPIEALVFNPWWYLLTDRRPASGHYYYLPWQAAYSRAPILGRNISVCAELESVKPKIIIWEPWRIWGQYNVQTYEPCLYEFVTTGYQATAESPIVLIRRDLGKE